MPSTPPCVVPHLPREHRSSARERPNQNKQPRNTCRADASARRLCSAPPPLLRPAAFAPAPPTAPSKSCHSDERAQRARRNLLSAGDHQASLLPLRLCPVLPGKPFHP